MTQGCAGWRDDLATFVIGALDGEERAAMKRHLATCPWCRADYEDLVPVRDWLARTRQHLAICRACRADYEDLLHLRPAHQEGGRPQVLTAQAPGSCCDSEVTALDPNERVAFRGLAGPVRPLGSYAFRPAQGGTAVTLTLDAKLTGIKRLLMGKQVQKFMEFEVASLDRAKSLLESSAQPGLAWAARVRDKRRADTAGAALA